MLKLNPEQWKVIGQALFTVGGPFAVILVQQFELSADKVNAWLNLGAVAWTILGGVWMTSSRTATAQGAAIANAPPEVKAAALAAIPDEDKISGVADATKVSAAGAVRGAEVKVDTQVASPSVLAVAMDPAENNVSVKE